MGDKMPKINHFNINSNFPAVAQADTATVTVTTTMPQTTLGPFEETYTYSEVTVSSGDIVSPTIYFKGNYYVGNSIADINDVFHEYAYFERISPTRLRFYLHLQNYDGSASQTHAQWSATAYVNIFRVP